MIAELVEVAVLLPLGALMGLRLLRRKPECSGYLADAFGHSEPRMMQDCTALRSPLCSDGRCSFHCSKMCRCDSAVDP